MGQLSTPPDKANPKLRVGAYLCLSEKHLYEVTNVNDDGSVDSQNVSTGYCCRLTPMNVKKARLVCPVPEEELAGFEAAYEAAPSIPDPDEPEA